MYRRPKKFNFEFKSQWWGGLRVERTFGSSLWGLETFAMYNGRTRLVVFLLGDPHLLEGGKRSEDGASNPDRVFPFWRSNNLNFHGRWSQRSDFLLHAVSNTRVHGGSSGQNSVGVQVLPDVNVAFHDGVVGGFMDTAWFHSQEWGLEDGLWAPEPLITDGDNLTVGQLITLLEGGWRGSSCHLLFKVQSNIAQLKLGKIKSKWKHSKMVLWTSK